MAINATKVPVHGVDLMLTISTDNGVTDKTLVCLTKQSNKISRSVNVIETQCGPIVSKGGSAKETVEVEGAVNLVLTAEQAQYISYKELRSLIKDGTAVKVTQKYPEDGTGINIEADGYLSDLSLDAPVENTATFSATLSIF